MTINIDSAKAISIREAGFDERWLQDQIAENPSCLGLGDLELRWRERQQSSGRLDLLLEDNTDDARYEVEIMLGETDETHIIRTIEYWDNEKRIAPQRQHFAVLVAEHINRRFFNVIHLLSYSIPIIAIQVALVEIGDKKALFFTKVLDAYEEIDDGVSLDDAVNDRNYWLEKATWTVETADALQAAIRPAITNSELRYLKRYIAINVGDKNYMRLQRRVSNRSFLILRLPQDFQSEATALLDEKNVTYVQKPKSIRINVDKEFVVQHAEMLRNIAVLIKRAREGTA